MKITDIKIDVIRREIPDTGLDSDLGRFAGTVEQGLLRILTDDGIEGNCYIGGFRGGGRSFFGPILNVLKPEILGRDPYGYGIDCQSWAPDGASPIKHGPR